MSSELVREFINTYNDQNRFQLVEKLFEQVLVINPTNGINDAFVDILDWSTQYLPLDLIKKMIDLGADPYYSNARPFIVSCCQTNTDIPLYFIKEYNIDVNIENGLAMNYCSSYDTLKILLENGYKISEDIIKNRMHRIFFNIKTIELLYEYGIAMEKIFEYALNNLNRAANELVDYFFTKIGMFINEPILLGRLLVTGCQKNILTIDQIKFFVESANLKEYIDTAFINSCCHDNVQISMYLLHECNANINAHNSWALYSAINLRKCQVVKFLLDSGIHITDDAITQIFDKEQYIGLLLNNGVDADRIAKLYVKYLFEHYRTSKNVNFAKALINSGIDLNQYILNYQKIE
jgi:hypothetical protein